MEGEAVKLLYCSLFLEVFVVNKVVLGAQRSAAGPGVTRGH